MSDGNKTLEEQDNSNDDIESYISVDVFGKDVKLWEKRNPRFLARIINSLKNLLNSQIPGRKAVHDEVKEALENIAASGQEVLKRPQLTNIEKMASIQEQLSKVKLNEALAKKAEAEANKINTEVAFQELEIEGIHQSQRVVDSLIKKGELYPMEKDGQLVFIYRPNKK